MSSFHKLCLFTVMVTHISYKSLIQLKVWDERKMKIRLGNALYIMHLWYASPNTCLWKLKSHDKFCNKKITWTNIFSRSCNIIYCDKNYDEITLFEKVTHNMDSLEAKKYNLIFINYIILLNKLLISLHVCICIWIRSFRFN